MNAAECVGQPCHWCGKPATHYCLGCDSCVCTTPACLAKSVRLTVEKLWRRRTSGKDFTTH